MNRTGRSAAVALALAVAALAHIPRAAHANERHFAFTHESATLPAGTFELEPWLTARLGRPTSYAALDYRFEFEVGLHDRLMLAVYANGTASAEGSDTATTARVTRAGFTGASVELKWRLLDSVADPLGLALYGELTGGPDSVEAEAQLIVDRRIGRALFAANLVYAHEWNVLQGGGLEDENEVQVLLAGAYFVTNQLAIGLEAREHNIFTPASFETAVVYAGPTVSYAASHFWVTLAVTPQLGALYGAATNDFRAYHDHEAVNARLVLGLHL
jgi:hypothetical protein